MVCNICPRNCNVERDEKRGFCKMPNTLFLSRAALHFWEEPCISGENGSGTVFFSGCNLRCVFCQNREISRGSSGKEISNERLVEIFFELKEKSANNINLVTPTHYIPNVIYAIKKAKLQGFELPFVYNSSGYESVESLKMLKGLIDIYLPDFKYFDEKPAKKYSFAENYPNIAKKAIEEMVSQQPKTVFDENNMMKKGVIVRHLVLPGYVENSEKIIKYLYEKYGDNIILSIMNQYTPNGELEKYPEINRRVTEKEYEEVVNFAIDTGVENAFIQEGETQSESFIPSFDTEGV